MIGFRFNNIHSNDMGVYAINLDRSALPSLRRRDYIIQGRHGSLDYGGNTYNTRVISMEIASMDNISMEAFRSHVREIAKWLSGEGYLIFDDEPDKAYQAKIYEAITIDPIFSEDYIIDPFNAGTMEISFECQPFAESPNYKQVISTTTSNRESLEVNVKGTQPSCCIIRITNTGSQEIRNINILRKAKI